jgi:hypothetical protein
MSDYSVNASNESNASTPAALRSPYSAPPISPRTAAVILQLNQQNPEAVMDVAQGLIASIHKAQTERGEEREVRDTRIRELEAQLEHERLQMPQAGEAPDGFVLNNNDRAPNFVIPIQDGYHQPAHWVRFLPRGQVAGLPQEHTPGSTPFVAEVYADRNEDPEHDSSPFILSRHGRSSCSQARWQVMGCCSKTSSATTRGDSLRKSCVTGSSSTNAMICGHASPYSSPSYAVCHKPRTRAAVASNSRDWTNGLASYAPSHVSRGAKRSLTEGGGTR